MGTYEENETPFDIFDENSIHQGFADALENKEENYLFMINVSEHVKRSSDMLMFLGEYFKELIKKQELVK